MLNHEIIHAVLQGLPTSFLAHLGDPWLVFCQRIEFALKNEAPPLSALKFALEKTDPRIVEFIARFIKETQRVTALPDLTRRQKELLIVLRTFGPATCAQLSRTLLQDRSHTHKRLAFLVTSGLVAKFHRWDGVYYLASRLPLDSSAAARPVAVQQPPDSHATTATNATLATSVMLPPRKSSPYFYRRHNSVPASRKLYSLKKLEEAVDRLPD